MPIPTELVGSLPRPEKLQDAYQDLRRRQDHVRGPAGRAGRGGRGLDQAPRGDRRADRLRRRAALVELRDVPDHRHAGRHRASPTTWRATASSSRSSPTATTASCRGSPAARSATRPTPPIRREEQRRSRPTPMKQAVISPSMLALLYPLEGEIDGLLARAVRRGPGRRVREGHPPGFAAGAVRVSVDFTEGRLANRNDPRNPWTGRGMLAALHRAQQPACFARFTADERAQHRHPHLPRRRPRLGAQRGRAVREPARADVPDQRRLLPHPVRQRGGQARRSTGSAASTAATTPTASRRSASSA